MVGLASVSIINTIYHGIVDRVESWKKFITERAFEGMDQVYLHPF